MRIFFRLTLSFLVIFTVTLCHAQVKKKVVKKTASAPVKQKQKPVAPVIKLPVKPSGVRVKITTDLGEIVVRLSDKTPLHRDNFIKLVNDHFYDSLIFHRIIAGFMIQGGDPESKHALPDIMLGKGDVGYTIPAEFDSTLYHKKGALAAARNNNPEKASSGCQFYIVQGKKYGEDELNMIQMQRGIYFSPAKRMTYKMLGGTPLLDMNYTVFGEVETGIEVVDQIAQSKKGNFDRSVTDIHMKMEVMK
ncbi:MAG: peptidylprolyl isomerase [Ferruginibacter sp.]|nr:peptidylprolyl isomerase [Ferruginibacter sp.]